MADFTGILTNIAQDIDNGSSLSDIAFKYQTNSNQLQSWLNTINKNTRLYRAIYRFIGGSRSQLGAPTNNSIVQSLTPPTPSVLTAGAFGRELLRTTNLGEARALIPFANVDDVGDMTGVVKEFAKGAATRFSLDSDGRPRLQAVNTDQILTESYPDPTTNTDGIPFREAIGTFTNASGYHNDVYRIGWNVGAGGTQQDVTRPTLKLEFEKDYLTGGKRFVEFHQAFTVPGAGSDQRFATFFGRWDDDPSTPSENSYGFNVDQIYHQNRGRTKQLWTSNETNGLKLTNIPFVTEHTDLDKLHLSLNGPTGQTEGFVAIKKNFQEIFSINRYGEVTMTGGNSGSGAGVNDGFLQVVGRSDNNAICSFIAPTNEVRLRVSSAAGAYAPITTIGQLIHTGPFEVRKLDGTTTAFACNEIGGVTFAASAAGAVSGVTGLSRALAVTIAGVGTFYIPLYTGTT